MKLLNIIFLLVLFNISILAKDILYKRIYITYTLEKKHIKSIYHTLHKMHIPMYIEKENNRYIIYTRKYLSNDAKVNNDFKIIKRKFKHAKILTKEKKSQEKNKVIKKEVKNTFCINLSTGSSNIKSTPSYNFTKNYALNYGVELAYMFSENISLSLEYLNTSQEYIDIHNIFTSINYTFAPSKNTFILFGLFGGYSTLEFNNQQDTKPSKSTLLGIKNRLGYKITDNFDLFIQYSGLYFEHILVIKDTSSNITFNYVNNVTLGLGVSF